MYIMTVSSSTFTSFAKLSSIISNDETVFLTFDIVYHICIRENDNIIAKLSQTESNSLVFTRPNYLLNNTLALVYVTDAQRTL